MMKRMRRQWLRSVLGVAAAGAILAPASAQAQITRVNPSDHRQAIGINLGGFFPRAEDSRVEGDVLNTDLQSLVFNIKDFNSGSIAGEWLVGLGDFLEAGVGIGFHQRTVPSIYAAFTNDDGSEIAQDLKLRVVPMTATVRFLPIGRASVEPYIGAGIGVFNWHYSEVGDFVDFAPSPPEVFHHRYVADGNAVGPVILAGIRAPFADVWDIGGEVQYRRAEGNTKPEETGLLDSKIDLGGWSAGLTMHIRF